MSNNHLITSKKLRETNKRATKMFFTENKNLPSSYEYVYGFSYRQFYKP